MLGVSRMPRKVVWLDMVLVDDSPLPPSTSTPQVEHRAAERPDANQYAGRALVGDA